MFLWWDCPIRRMVNGGRIMVKDLLKEEWKKHKASKNKEEEPKKKLTGFGIRGFIVKKKRKLFK